MDLPLLTKVRHTTTCHSGHHADIRSENGWHDGRMYVHKLYSGYATSEAHSLLVAVGLIIGFIFGTSFLSVRRGLILRVTFQDQPISCDSELARPE